VIRMSRVLSVALVCVAVTAPVLAQDPPAPAPQPAAARSQGLVPLKVMLVFSRFQGEKKISSVPYTLFVTANLNERTSLRMGNQVPVTTTMFGGGSQASIPQTSYQYRDVGTNIDCSAHTAADGYYRITLTVTDSSVAYAEGDTAARTAPPTFRNFNSTFNILVRDGQTVQYTSAADPISGQVIKLDATVNVQK
jgi:hypothetical protein